MKITLKDLGPLRYADFDINSLTIICGGNNTGKTYATHATYAFLDFIRTNAEISIEDDLLDRLINSGTVSLHLDEYKKDIQKYLDISAQNYSNLLPNVFASSSKLFEKSSFNLKIPKDNEVVLKEIEIRVGSSEKSVLKIESNLELETMEVSLLSHDSNMEIPPRRFLRSVIADGLGQILFGEVLPKPFIASAERTGAAIFQKELDFTRNRLLEMLGDKSTKLSPVKLLGKFGGEYPIAVNRNVDFIRELSTITHRESYILKKHPELLEEFKTIIGGEYKVSKDGDVQYLPNQRKKVRLSLMESSSAVRSLLDIGFYLRHIASPGDILMVDEPELNLHPENQRKLARLFASLVNVGIKVFVTTHSDYMVKEFSTLLMLNQNDERFKKIREREGYKEGELLNANEVNLYIAEEGLVKPDGASRKIRCQTLQAVSIDQKNGIDARSFDTTIEEMNRIHEDIIWGE